MRAIVLVLFALASSTVAAGCIDTRGPCEVACDNQVRCGYAADRSSCLSSCGATAATLSPDCRTTSDAYERCWSSQNNCPPSRTGTAPGCEDESIERALACTAI